MISEILLTHWETFAFATVEVELLAIGDKEAPTGSCCVIL